MITNVDCILLLSELEEQGNKEATKLIERVASSSSVDLEVLRFINKNRPLDVLDFYEHIRKNYNQKKSKLYINIVKEIDKPDEVLTTLSSLLTQILLYNKNVDNKVLFLKHSRAEEISKVLVYYFKTYDITKAISLIKLIKADLKALESINEKKH